jgi:hypothetical protein
MPADKLESELAVIYVDIFPRIAVVAGAAVRLELGIMCIVFQMAGGACHRRALEHSILVAVGAGEVRMLTAEFELSQPVVEFCGFPAGVCVAVSARRTKPPGVRLVFRMASGAVRWSGF